MSLDGMCSRASVSSVAGGPVSYDRLLPRVAVVARRRPHRRRFAKQMIRQERQPTLDNQKMAKIGRMQSSIKRPDKSLQHKMLMKLLRHALFKQ